MFWVALGSSGLLWAALGYSEFLNVLGCMGLFEKPPAGAGSVGIRALLQKRGLKRKYIALGTRSLH